MKTVNYFTSLFAVLLFSSVISLAQDKEAKMTILFEKHDTIRMCRVFVTSEDKPVAEVSVKIYVQRLFSLLPVGDAVSTDENGDAEFIFPDDIPGDSKGMLTVFAKIEDDENYGNLETKGEIRWGLIKSKSNPMERSLSASRDKAPIYFIIASNLIIAGIWGTLIYVIFQLFKIRRISRHLIRDHSKHEK